LEGGEKIVEEEEGDEENHNLGQQSRRNSSVGAAALDTRRASIASSSKKLDTIVATGSALAAEKRRKYENDKEELLRQAKRYGIGLRELRAEFGKTPKIQKVDCRHKLQRLGFSVASWDDEKIALLFGGLDDGPASGWVHTDRILKLFAPDIQEEKMACELPDMEEDGDTPGSIHREGILEIELHGASGLAGCEQLQSLVQRKVRIKAPAFSVSQNALRRRIAYETLERDPAMAWQLRHFARKSELLVRTPYASPKLNHETSVRTSPNPVTTFYEVLEKEYAARIFSRMATQDETELATPVSRTPVYSKRDGMSPFFPALSPKSTPGWTIASPPSNALDLHKSNRIRDLEAKRSAKLTSLLQHKQQALGDAEKTSSLPRLIGGRKSGSSHVKCVDCGIRVLVGGRAARHLAASQDANSYPCSGASCVNTLCASCYVLLPAKGKLCEECFQHEICPEETFGEQLRVVLIEKIGASDQQRSRLEEVFHSFDADGSGSLSPQEFEKMLQLLNIQPALTQGQRAFLVDQFDANADGEISLTEFKHWILRDHVWEESAAPSTGRGNRSSTAAEAFDSVIAPVCNEIIDRAYDAYVFSSTVDSWSRSTSTTTESQTNSSRSEETGAVIFQRVISLAIASGVDFTAAEKFFEQVDGDGSGNIDQFEFVGLLSTLGIHLSSEDAILLMNRLDAASASNGRITIERPAFMSYVARMSTKASTRVASLSDTLLTLDALASTNASSREILQQELQQLHENASDNELVAICKAVDEKADLTLTMGDLRSLAGNLSFEFELVQPNAISSSSSESAEQRVSMKSSGDLLSRVLLVESSALMKCVKDFNVDSVCAQLATHLEARSGSSSTKNTWRSVFGVDTAVSVRLGDFIAQVLKTGFLITADLGTAFSGDGVNGRLLTQLILSLAVDAVRKYCHAQPTKPPSFHPEINFNLFRLIMRIQKLKEIELKFDHALANFLQLCQGEQQHLVTIALDADRNLVIRAQDPIFKICADFTLREDEYDYRNLMSQLCSNTFERRLLEKHEVSRELTFIKSPHGLITGDLYPELNNSMLDIVGRLRVDFRLLNASATSHNLRLHGISLSMVESELFVSTLRNLFSQVELPFFWSVSHHCLVLSIDSEVLDQQGQPSFQQLVADTLSLHGSHLPPQLRVLATFVAHTASSLVVRYEVVGKHSNVETSWQEFQDFIAGHQHMYAVLELHPQGSLFSTQVARASGSGAVRWNFKTQVSIEEPKLCDRRIDRPVIFTDTVKILSVPGSTPMSENINFVVGDTTDNPGHFVVMSVRRALQAGPESPNPRLYCTAYDPLTSCDYEVEGYPSDWSVDFFDVTINPGFESRWQQMLETMRLGPTITPKLSITVFNKQPKTDKLVGECEVSVGSAITQEGHIFEERVALGSPASQPQSLPTGVAAITFRFDVKAAPVVPNVVAINDRRSSHHATGTPVPIKLGAQYLAGEIATPRNEPVEMNNDDKLNQLQTSIIAIEQAKLEAQEQVRHLKAQVQQLSYAANNKPDDAAERWKRRLEQARQEQFAAEQEHATRYITRVTLLSDLSAGLTVSCWWCNSDWQLSRKRSSCWRKKTRSRRMLRVRPPT